MWVAAAAAVVMACAPTVFNTILSSALDGGSYPGNAAWLICGQLSCAFVRHAPRAVRTCQVSLWESTLGLACVRSRGTTDAQSPIEMGAVRQD